MIKNIISLSTLLILSLWGTAQEVESSSKSLYQSPASDFFMIHIQNEIWNDKPDSIKKKAYSPSVGIYINKDFPINNSNFSVSVGLGISASNVNFENNQVMYFKDSSEIKFYDTISTYKKYKYNQAYLELPVELRYFGNKLNRNKGFKAALGLKVANLLSAHTRMVYNEGADKYREKLSTKRFAEKWRLTPYLRMGWGNFALMASYQITSVFELDKGPAIYPLSFGFSITGL